MRAGEADAAADRAQSAVEGEIARPAVSPTLVARPEAVARKPRAGKPVASVMCTTCGSMNLHAHLQGDKVLIKCRGCDTIYQDLLELVPVKEVGPFAFVFGEGWRGAATFVLLAALVVAVGVALRWSS